MNLSLRILKVKDVSQSYIDWFKIPEVIRYSENQYRLFSLDSQKDFVNSCLKKEGVDLYGIFDNNLHIGNIQINDFDSIHKRAEITYVVGDTNYWCRGVGSFAVSKIIQLSKKKYFLNKLYAGVDKRNLSSIKVLEKNGFILEGIRKKHLYFENEFQDQLDYGLLL